MATSFAKFIEKSIFRKLLLSYVKVVTLTLFLREDSFIDFVRRNVPGTFRRVGVLLFDVSVKMEIIDFLQPRIKQKLLENIIITPEKCVIGIDYVHP